MTLVADIHAQVGELRLDLELRVEPNETVAILGPNGAGKTTLLRVLAGLIPLHAGCVSLDGSTLDDGATEFVEPERRPVGFVFQDYLLFPHLNALDNVAFGLRCRGASRSTARAEAAEWLETVGLGDRTAAQPRELSGGEAQRVALARALATEPRLLLLDEPLAALDPTARNQIRRELRKRLHAFDGMRVIVTHDPLDAAVLADRLVVLEHGAVIQTGTLMEIASRPQSRYVADLVGATLLSGLADGNRVTLDNGTDLVVVSAGSGASFAVIDPRSVTLHRERPTGSARNVWHAEVESIERIGDRTRVRVGGSVPLVAEITAAALHDLALAEGQAIWASVKATDITVFPS